MLFEILVAGMVIEGTRTLFKKAKNGARNISSSIEESSRTYSYRRQAEWDQKKAELQQELVRRERERDKYLPDSARLNAMELRITSLQNQIKEVRANMEANKQKQQRLRQQMEEMQSQKSCEAIATAWRKKAREEAEQMIQILPNLEQKTEELAAEHISAVERQGDDAEKQLEAHRQKLLKEKEKKQKESKSLREKQQKLASAIAELDKLLGSCETISSIE